MTPEERAKILEEARPYWMAYCAGLVSEARNQALEEAAKVAETWPQWDDSAGQPWETVAAAIRALQKDEGE